MDSCCKSPHNHRIKKQIWIWYPTVPSSMFIQRTLNTHEAVLTSGHLRPGIFMFPLCIWCERDGRLVLLTSPRGFHLYSAFSPASGHCDRRRSPIVSNRSPSPVRQSIAVIGCSQDARGTDWTKWEKIIAQHSAYSTHVGGDAHSDLL